MTFGPSPTSSPSITLALQPYIPDPSCKAILKSTNIEEMLSQYYSSPPQIEYLLVHHEQPSTDELRVWLTSLEPAPPKTFEAAMEALIFQLQKRPLQIPPPGEANSNDTYLRKYSDKKMIPGLDLSRHVFELTCWLRLWRNPLLYGHDDAKSPFKLSPTALSQLKELIVNPMVDCERLVFLELEKKPSSRNGGCIDLYMWANLWQLILIYRRMMTEDSQFIGSEPNTGKTG